MQRASGRAALGVLVAAVAIGVVRPTSAGTAATAAAKTVSVFSAASLSDVFRAISTAFAAQRAGTSVDLNFAGSSLLAQQINEGAPADVFAAADEANMQKAAAAGSVAGPPRIFATNRLTIAVAAGNPEHIASLADLTASRLTVALAAPAVPAGKYAAEAFARAGVNVPAASQEVDVRAVLNKIAIGEADAGIVYVTDIRAAAGKVEAVAIPDAQNVVARYPIAVLAHAANPQGAQAFVAFVLSAPGQTVLRESGFGPP